MTATGVRTLPVVPDARWWLDNVPCRAACPVHTDAGGYVTAIAQGRFEDAYRIARAPNPFPSICGRVCAAPCEQRCRRGALDAPIAIRALKRFIAERFGVEAADHASRWREAVGTLPADTGRVVAIIGGGPAGLACAHDLRLRGHGVTIVEASGRLGGMMIHGIPPFRLARALLEGEMAEVVALGVDVRLHTRVGREVSLETLLTQFDAVFVAAGTGVGRLLDVEGIGLQGVTSAAAFLADTFASASPMVGEHVVVVGGGSVAFDAARTAARARRAALAQAPTLEGEGDPKGNVNADANTDVGTHALDDSPAPPTRPQQSSGDDVRSWLDAARTARRAAGPQGHVTIVALEGRDELSADADEWREAEHEGVRVLYRRSVQRITGSEHVRGVELLPVTQVFASDGQFAPVVDATAPRELLPCDTVVFAVGQEADTSFLPPALVQGGLAGVDRHTLRTQHPRVWAGGDIAFGPRHLIDAIADGKRAAAGISAMLDARNEPSHEGGKDAHAPGADASPAAPMADSNWGLPVVAQAVSSWRREWTAYDATPRAVLPTTAATARTMGREVELVLDEPSARREANRCLRCHVNVTLRADRCILCGLCADVCPERCIQLRADAVSPASVTLVLDEARCIRCGLCVERCPPHALTMVEVTSG